MNWYLGQEFCSDIKVQLTIDIYFPEDLFALNQDNALFPGSEAKGKLVLFRSQQRRLRLVLLQQRGNSSAMCRALSRQLHIWIDQQRGNMLPTRMHPVSFLTAGQLFTRDLVPKHMWHTVLQQF